MSTFQFARLADFDKSVDWSRYQSDRSYFDAVVKERNRIMDEEFRAAVQNAGWSFAEKRARSRFANSRLALLVGAAKWSKPDRELLTDLHNALAGTEINVFVLDLDGLTDLSQVQCLVPSLVQLPSQTRFLAVLRHGQLIGSFEGDDSTAFVHNVLPAMAAKE